MLEKRIRQETFLRKVLTSFFTGTIGALGATVGFALLIFSLTFLYNNFQDAPLIGDFLQNSRIIEIIIDSLSTNADSI